MSSCVDNYYSKPYPPIPAGKPDSWNVDHSPVFGVNKPNHSLANALRKAALVPLIIDECTRNYRAGGHLSKTDFAEFSEELKISMQVAMLFEVCGRESDIGYCDDPDVFLIYHRNSCTAFQKYIKSTPLSSKHVSDALERMYMSPKNEASRPIKHVFEMAHDLDLFRCYDEDKMIKKLDSIKNDVGRNSRDRLVQLAESAIEATGDRIIYSFSGRPKRGYIHGIFDSCSTEPAVCWQAIQTCFHTCNDSSNSSIGSQRTFLTSNYKVCYEATAEPPRRSHQVLAALDDLIKAYCTFTGESSSDGETFYKELEKVVLNKPNELIHEVAGAAERLWSATPKLGGEISNGPELCSIMNDIIRRDNPALLKPLVILTRSISTLLVSRNIRKKEDVHFPPNGRTYRGGLLPNEYRTFFSVGKQYAVPGFVATSFSHKIATRFAKRAFRADNGQKPAVIWAIQVNPDGEKDDDELCQNANFLKSSEVPGEEEYLFMPYSVFTVRHCEWSDSPTPKAPHRITIEAAEDSLYEPKDLPLAPWS